jgi:hypothetical protein
MLCRPRRSHLLQFSRPNGTADNRWTPARALWFVVTDKETSVVLSRARELVTLILDRRGRRDPPGLENSGQRRISTVACR